MIAAPLALPVLAGTGLYATWSDARYRRLPNWLTALVAGSGLAVTLQHGGLAPAASAALHATVALLIGMMFFARGLIGGGDIKYYAATAAWFPIDHGFRLLGSVSFAGFFLALGWLAWRRFHTLPDTLKSGDDADKLPFGIAIAAGALLAALPS